MERTFRSIADLDVPIVDADAHVNEPPDLWQDRVPPQWRDRAPRVVRDDHGGDRWVFDDGAATRPVGLSATAGLSVVQFRADGGRYSDMRPGSYDAKARLADLDADGVDRQVLYPSVTLEGARVCAHERDLQRCCVRAYNEWLAEFCRDTGGRLSGLAVMPTTGVDDALAELEVALALGHRGFLLSCFPNGSRDPEPDDERFWGAVEASGLPAAVHIGSFVAPRVSRWPDTRALSFLAVAGAAKAGAHAIELAATLLFSGAFERCPGVRVALAEAGIGWIPTALEQLDAMFLRYRWVGEAVERMQAMPSELFRRNVWATFIVDRVGLEHLDRLHPGHVCWSSDYPHDTSDWPSSRLTIEHQFRGLPLDEVRAMVSTNAARLYGLDVASASRGSNTSESARTV
ncbi:MAG TPA: amidohydrolase family protein [Acidimicrobiia bacterium]|nr:amidohydrolase family protein [Acidimicrobiia bacterium]